MRRYNNYNKKDTQIIDKKTYNQILVASVFYRMIYPTETGTTFDDELMAFHAAETHFRTKADMHLKMYTTINTNFQRLTSPI